MQITVGNFAIWAHITTPAAICTMNVLLEGRICAALQGLQISQNDAELQLCSSSLHRQQYQFPYLRDLPWR